METTTTVDTPAKATTKPVHTIRLSGLSVSIFHNRVTVRDRGEMTLYNTILQRTYMDKKDDQFKTTSSFGRDDLPVAQLLLQRAWEWILDEEARQKTTKA